MLRPTDLFPSKRLPPSDQYSDSLRVCMRARARVYVSAYVCMHRVNVRTCVGVPMRTCARARVCVRVCERERYHFALLIFTTVSLFLPL